MKIQDLRSKNSKRNDVGLGSIISYDGDICLVAESRDISAYSYTIVNIDSGYIVKAYKYLSDIDEDDKVEQLDEKFNCEFVIKDKKEGSEF